MTVPGHTDQGPEYLRPIPNSHELTLADWKLLVRKARGVRLASATSGSDGDVEVYESFTGKWIKAIYWIEGQALLDELSFNRADFCCLVRHAAYGLGQDVVNLIIEQHVSRGQLPEFAPLDELAEEAPLPGASRDVGKVCHNIAHCETEQSAIDALGQPTWTIDAANGRPLPGTGECWRRVHLWTSPSYLTEVALYVLEDGSLVKPVPPKADETYRAICSHYSCDLPSSTKTALEGDPQLIPFPGNHAIDLTTWNAATERTPATMRLASEPGGSTGDTEVFDPESGTWLRAFVWVGGLVYTDKRVAKRTPHCPVYLSIHEITSSLVFMGVWSQHRDHYGDPLHGDSEEVRTLYRRIAACETEGAVLETLGEPTETLEEPEGRRLDDSAAWKRTHAWRTQHSHFRLIVYVLMDDSIIKALEHQ